MTDALKLVHRFEPGSAEHPTLLLLHGTGGDENDLLPLGQALLPGAALLSPRGAVLERGQPRFFRRLAEGVFDLEDLHLRTAELATFIRDAAALYQFDAESGRGRGVLQRGQHRGEPHAVGHWRARRGEYCFARWCHSNRRRARISVACRCSSPRGVTTRSCRQHWWSVSEYY